MTKQVLRCSLVALLVEILPLVLFGWGRDGHAVIAALAEAHLTKSAQQNVQALLGVKSLASIASWADEVRSERDETYNWHFVDIPKSKASFDETRDCYRPDDNHEGAKTDHHNCVVDRIEMFKRVLADPSASQSVRSEALKFIVHFVGDVHQPFHAIGDAKGANDIHITEFGSTKCGNRSCNLHSAWDDGLIAHTGMNQSEYVAHLERLIIQQNLSASGNPEDWANESHRYAQAAWLNDGGDVDENYYKTQIKVIDERLALAGLRLAALLNDVFGSPTPQATETGTNLGNEVEVNQVLNLRPEPSAGKKPFAKVRPGDEVTLIESSPSNGYAHVMTEDGRDGWLAQQYLSIKRKPNDVELYGEAPASAISEDWDKPEPNKTTFRGPDGNCPWNGNDTDPDTYTRKNRSDVPDQYHLVLWSAIHDLPFPDDKPIRANWSAEHLAEIAKYEGTALTTVGYIVAIKPQAGHGEGTNCDFTASSETDTHIALVGKPGDGEDDSIVIEFTPRFLKLHKHWNKTFLSSWLDADVPMRISGWLLLDPDHRNHLNRYRYTLWEIHPITKIEVYVANQWKDVDEMR